MRALICAGIATTALLVLGLQPIWAADQLSDAWREVARVQLPCERCENAWIEGVATGPRGIALVGHGIHEGDQRVKGDGPFIASSLDGRRWHFAPQQASLGMRGALLRDITAWRGRWWAVGSTHADHGEPWTHGDAWSSSDGIDWQHETAGMAVLDGATLNAAVGTPDGLVAVGHTGREVEDQVTWAAAWRSETASPGSVPTTWKSATFGT